jgi:predicted nucleic acid-binding protein
MRYLLDTCVLSELVSAKPSRKVIRWVDGQNEHGLHLSILTMGELYKGIAKLPASSKKTRLEAWVDGELQERFRDRILAIDDPVARVWGDIQGTAERLGHRMPVIDSLIAATALTHDLIVVTRNPRHITASGVDVHNPWA